MFDDEYYPAISGIGSMHDLDDRAPPPRLWGMRSVSKAAARALDRRQAASERQVGFAAGRVR